MVAGRADLRGLLADDDVSTVSALPDLDLALREDLGHLDVVQQCAIALLMMLLDRSDEAETLSELREALFLCGLREALVHIGPLVVLALGRCLQVLCGIPDAVQLLEPELRVLLLVVCGLQEQRSDLLVAFLLRLRREVGILVARLRFTGECLHQVLLGLCACILILFHHVPPFIIY